jgi:ketosteroid isomerase-like protein
VCSSVGRCRDPLERDRPDAHPRVADLGGDGEQARAVRPNLVRDTPPAMAEGNAEIVQRFLARVNGQDLDAALALVSPDAELDWTDSEAPDSGRYDGPAEWGGWIRGRWEGLGDATFETVELREVAPDRVLIVAEMRGRGRASGLEIAALAAAVITLRGGLITGLRLYQSPEEALRALGLDA